MTELIPSLFVPVILGGDREAIRAAKRLFWRYGMATHLFGDRLPLYCRLTPWIVCHALPQELSSEFFTMALYDFAVEMQECDRQPLLIICNDLPFSKEELALLESCYLICREDELAARLTPDQHLPEGGKPI